MPFESRLCNREHILRSRTPDATRRRSADAAAFGGRSVRRGGASDPDRQRNRAVAPASRLRAAHGVRSRSAGRPPCRRRAFAGCEGRGDHGDARRADVRGDRRRSGRQGARGAHESSHSSRLAARDSVEAEPFGLGGFVVLGSAACNGGRRKRVGRRSLVVGPERRLDHGALLTGDRRRDRVDDQENPHRPEGTFLG